MTIRRQEKMQKKKEKVQKTGVRGMSMPLGQKEKKVADTTSRHIQAV